MKYVASCLSAVLLAAGCLPASATEAIKGWITPTPEELSMKSVASVPDAPAIYLNREKITLDDLHVEQHYARIKVLTEKGKEFATVRIAYYSSRSGVFEAGNDKTVDSVSGRTVHADGTVVPFTGKPNVHAVVRAGHESEQEISFEMPQVEVGSILEYRYSVRLNDHMVEVPTWDVQENLFTRSAHFVWYPTSQNLVGAAGAVDAIVWFPVLPPGNTVTHVELPQHGQVGAKQYYELNVRDVPPLPNDSYMPPLRTFAYRVLFSYSAYHGQEEFWRKVGQSWSHTVDEFAGPNGALKSATQTLVSGEASDEGKLRKIYAATQELENTDYTRTRGAEELRARSEREGHTANEVLVNKRGDGDEIAMLFVGMARAAGMPAYAMLVTDRNDKLFVPQYLSLQQFTHIVAIVNVGGKEMFFDPGSRYCAYGKLRWNYTYVQGLRQVDHGSGFAQTPGTTYPENIEQRVGDLTLSADGKLSGTLQMTYTGAGALEWRERLLRGDDQALRKQLAESVERALPKGAAVRVVAMDHEREYDQPLVTLLSVEGLPVQTTAHRLLLPADFIVSDEPEAFPQPKREIAVDFSYPRVVKDAVRIKLPPGERAEVTSQPARTLLKSDAAYTLSVEAKPDAVIVRRNLTIGQFLIPAAEYAELRSFYGTLEAKDRETLVFTSAAGPQTPASAK